MKRRAFISFAAAAALLSGCAPAPAPVSDKVREYYEAIPSPTLPTSQTVGVIGDSFTSGSKEGGNDATNWTRLVEAEIQRKRADTYITAGAYGGGGWLALGPFGQGFMDGVSKVATKEKALLVFFGSVNDSAKDVEAYQSKVRETLTAARAGSPNAKLLIIGPPAVRPAAHATLAPLRDVLASEAQAAGADFVDPLTDQWFTDRPDLIGADGVHPTDEGHKYMAERILPAVARNLP